jgi:hypothetical protein
MAQTMYAHMNKEIKNKNIDHFSKKECSSALGMEFDYH